MSILHSAARLPVAEMLISNISESPGSILAGSGGNEIAKSYGSKTVNWIE